MYWSSIFPRRSTPSRWLYILDFLDWIPKPEGALKEEPTMQSTPLPKFQLFLTLLIQLTEPVTATLIYPFIAIAVSGFTQGDEKKTGYYAGIIVRIPSVYFQQHVLIFPTGIGFLYLRIVVSVQLGTRIGCLRTQAYLSDRSSRTIDSGGLLRAFAILLGYGTFKGCNGSVQRESRVVNEESKLITLLHFTGLSKTMMAEVGSVIHGI